MSLSEPKQVTFYLAAVLWLLGLLGYFVPAIEGLFTDAPYWLAIAGGLVLIVGNVMDGV